MRHWPAHEIFAFERDTRAYYGNLDGLLPAYTDADIREGVRVEAANLYHVAVHLYLSKGESAAGDLAGLLKPASFLLKWVCYLRPGAYPDTRAELEAGLQQEERTLLRPQQDPAAQLDAVLRLCGRVLTDI